MSILTDEEYHYLFESVFRKINKRQNDNILRTLLEEREYQDIYDCDEKGMIEDIIYFLNTKKLKTITISYFRENYIPLFDLKTDSFIFKRKKIEE